MNLQDQLLAIERRLWTNDAEVYDVHVTDQALMAFAETGIITKNTALQEIKRENQRGKRWADVQFNEVRAITLGPQAGLLTYRVSARHFDEPSSMEAIASSVYVKEEDRWKLAFHQQTRLPQSERKRGGDTRADGRVRSAMALPARAIGASSAGAVAFGAFALGATAVGALAIGRLAVGSLALRRGHVRTLTIDDLQIGRLLVRE
jgi:hypothetical protein